MKWLLKLRRKSFINPGRWWSKRFGGRSLAIPLAMLVGIVAALLAGLLHNMVHYLELLSQRMSRTSPLLFGCFLLLPLAGMFFSFIIQRFAGGVRYAKSLSPLILSLHRRQSRIPFTEMFTHMLSSAVSVGLGGSAGLEAPSVLTGAAVGANTSSLFGVPRRMQILLIGCGGSAAIAAIFQSPIGGVLFAIEVLMPEFSVAALVPMLISSAVAMVISRTCFPHEQVLLAINTPWRTDAIPFYFLCGLCCALVGVYMLKVAHSLAAILKKAFPSRYKKLFICGVMLCVILALFPILRGQGTAFIAQLFDGNTADIAAQPMWLRLLPSWGVVVIMVAAAIFVKVIASIITVDGGGDGGIFAPTMFVGAFTGFAFARLINLTGIIELQEPNFVVVGICGVFSAVLRAPLTGIFLIADVTDSYILLVPLMIVSSVSWAAARHFEPHSIYRKPLADSGLLSDDRDLSMLQRFSVRMCVKNDYAPLRSTCTLTQLQAKLPQLHSKEIFPVLDEKKKLSGIIYTKELLPLLLSPELNPSLLVFDLMAKPRCTISIDDNLASAMEYLERFKLDYLPVNKKDGSVSGFVSRSDIFKLYRSLIRDADRY